MTKAAAFRYKTYKSYLRKLICAKKGHAYRMKLKKVTAREIEAWARETVRGVSFTNVARDIRALTEPGETYDPEFDLLYRGQVVPEVIERYSETFLAKLVKGAIAPCDMDRRLAALRQLRPDGGI